MKNILITAIAFASLNAHADPNIGIPACDAAFQKATLAAYGGTPVMIINPRSTDYVKLSNGYIVYLEVEFQVGQTRGFANMVSVPGDCVVKSITLK